MDATPRFDTGNNHYGAWWGIHPPHENIPKTTSITDRVSISTLFYRTIELYKENTQLKRTVDELHKRNHELIENQSKIEQKARTQQRQYDAKVYAYWKNKAETLAQKVLVLENEAKKVEGLQTIVSKLMDRVLDRSKKLIAINRILNGNTE